jgi:Alpha/beta hydrolase domain
MLCDRQQIEIVTMGRIRPADVAVVLPTYTLWALRAAAVAGDDLCDAVGQRSTCRRRSGSGLRLRMSIEDRYPVHEKYVRKVTNAASQLTSEGLQLDEDVEHYLADAGGQ